MVGAYNHKGMGRALQPGPQPAQQAWANPRTALNLSYSALFPQSSTPTPLFAHLFCLGCSQVVN